MQQIYHKKNELFEVEFYEDKECTKAFDFTNAKNIYLQGDIATLLDLLATQNVDTEANIYMPYLTNTWKELCLQDLFSSPYITLDDITLNLSKYIPDDNAVLFLDYDTENQYNKCFRRREIYTYINGTLNGTSTLENIFYYGTQGVAPQITIFLRHGTQSELQKANEVAKELKEKYGVEEVNLSVLHNFLKLTDSWDYDLAQTLFDGVAFGGERSHARIFSKFANMTPKERVSTIFINKIITTNSTGILPVQDTTEHLQVVDCKEIFEEYLKENN